MVGRPALPRLELAHVDQDSRHLWEGALGCPAEAGPIDTAHKPRITCNGTSNHPIWTELEQAMAEVFIQLIID